MTGLDTARDATALVRAIFDNDDEAAAAILDHADLRAVAIELAIHAGAAIAGVVGSDARAIAYLASRQRGLIASEADSGEGTQ